MPAVKFVRRNFRFHGYHCWLYKIIILLEVKSMCDLIETKLINYIYAVYYSITYITCFLLMYTYKAINSRSNLEES